MAILYAFRPIFGYAPFHTKVIAANGSEAAHILDEMLHHDRSLDMREHYTDTAGAVDHVFGLCHLTGFRFSAHIRDLADHRTRDLCVSRPG